ncbi:unnamed protein product [Umbelopsis ramanniana]
MKPSLNQRYAHAEGHTVVKYTLDGSAIITAGSDSLIRVFKTAKDERDAAATTIDKHSEAIQSIAVHRSNFATAGDDGIVCVFGNSTLDFEKMLVRSVSAVRMISYSPSGSKIAVASDEETIRMFNVNDISIVIPIKGHKKFVKCVEFDPKGDFLISSACDGEVRVWDLDSAEGGVSCVATLPSIVPSTDQDSNIRATVSWRPNGAAFAVPGKNKDVQLIGRGTWQPIAVLKDGHDENITTLNWSPNGNYLATATTSGQVCIWDVSEKEIVAKYQNAIEVSGLSWHPTGNVLAFTDRYGQMTTWEDVVPMQEKTLPHPALAHATISHDEVDELFGDTREPNGVRRQRGIDDMDRDDGEDNMSDLDDFVIDDDGDEHAEIGAGRRHQNRPNNGTNTSVIQQLLSAPQQPFQSGSTPYKHTNDRGEPLEGERRYLAFNMVGVIYTIFQGTHSVINVEFHDKSQNRNFHFQDYFNYSMASLGKKGAVFAVEASDSVQSENMDGEEQPGRNPSRIYYRALGGLADNAEWSMRLPDGEEVIALAVNDVSVIVATTANYIRIFTLSGLQVHIFNLSNMVAIAAAADLALLVYHGGIGVKGEPKLECLVYNTDKMETIQRSVMVTSPGASIQWIGFSETSLPASYDSNGILSVLFKQRRPDQATWVPVFDGSKVAQERGLDEHYWPVGLLRDQIMCLVLKRKINQYPTFPRPVISNIILQMPFLHMDSETTKLEESYVRTNIMSTHERDEATATSQEDEFHRILSNADIEMDKALLRLIQFACKAEKSQRAIDIAKSLHLSRSLDAAVKIATHHRMPALAERFNQIKETKFMSSINDDLTSSFESQSLNQGPRIFSSSNSSLSSQLAFQEPTPSLFSPSVRNIKLAQRKRDQLLSQDTDSDMDNIPGSPARKKTREGQASPIPSRTLL